MKGIIADVSGTKAVMLSENGEFLTACMDTGHTNKAMRFYNNPSPGDFIRSLGPRLGILHLHDNNGHWDDHLLPGMGNIDWPAVFDSLDEIGYSGVYNFELAMRFGSMREEFVRFAGKYLRAFVDGHGKL